MTNSVVMGMGSAAFLLFTGLVVLWAGKACADGVFGRNNTLGIRTRWTLASDEAWEVGHKAGGRRVTVGGIGCVIGSTLAILSGLLILLEAPETAINSVITALIIASCLWLIGWLLAAGKAANQAARALQP